MFEESPFTGACAASTWEVLAMILGSVLLGLLLGYLIWGWLRGRILQLEQRNKELERIAHLKDSQIVDLHTRIKALDNERERLSGELRVTASQHTNAMNQIATLNERLEGLMQAAQTAAQEAPAAPDTPEEADGTIPESLAKTGAVFGRKVKPNDLTIVEGIGPKISGLLTDAGISTWIALGNAKIDTLRQVLHDAGPRYHMHDPKTWPRQARMAAQGEWKKLKLYQDSLNRGR
jgi:predicted flap endonuclease-1-like 5' DNA nuclease